MGMGGGGGSRNGRAEAATGQQATPQGAGTLGLGDFLGGLESHVALDRNP